MPRQNEDRITSPEGIAALMSEHGLSQARVGELVHVSERQVRKWLNRDAPTPKWADELLRCKAMLGMLGQ